MARISNSRVRGFTVIELMTVVAVLAVLMVVVAPGMQKMLAGQRVRATAFDMVSDLSLARSEAIKRGENVVVAPAASGWLGGWQVRVASTAQVLRQKDALGAGVQISTAPTTVRAPGSTARVSVARSGKCSSVIRDATRACR